MLLLLHIELIGRLTLDYKCFPQSNMIKVEKVWWRLVTNFFKKLKI